MKNPSKVKELSDDLISHLSAIDTTPDEVAETLGYIKSSILTEVVNGLNGWQDGVNRWKKQLDKLKKIL